jgi:hypothetical protein
MANPVAGIWWFPGIVQRQHPPLAGKRPIQPAASAAPFRYLGNFALLLVCQ